MARQIDDNLRELLEILPAGWSLDSYRRSPHGWTAALSFKERQFLLTSEFLYINVAELIGKKRKKPRDILPAAEQRETITPTQVCRMLYDSVASQA